jgi:hypothetical protein
MSKLKGANQVLDLSLWTNAADGISPVSPINPITGKLVSKVTRLN